MKQRSCKIVLFMNKFREWRWTMRSKNGRVIGASTEGYKNRAMAIRNIRAVTGFNPTIERGSRATRFELVLTGPGV